VADFSSEVFVFHRGQFRRLTGEDRVDDRDSVQSSASSQADFEQGRTARISDASFLQNA
jgi:hypothetical protein